MVTVSCLGTVRATDTNGVEVSLRSRKHTGLLLYLVAHPRTVHVREELAYLLWSANDKKARHSLSQALYDIRATLGPVITVDANTVRLSSRGVPYELDELESAIEAGDLDKAVDLCRGELAPDLLNLGAEAFDRWLDEERERCRVLATVALRNACAAAELIGDWDKLCLAALRLTKLSPFDESAHLPLMRGLSMKGDTSSAIAHYRHVKTRLEGITLPALETFVRRIQAGANRFRRAGRPQFGRAVDFSAALEALSDPGAQLLVLGEAGVGKSEFLHHLACHLELRGTEVRWGWTSAVEREGPRSAWKRLGGVVFLDGVGDVGGTRQLAVPGNVSVVLAARLASDVIPLKTRQDRTVIQLGRVSEADVRRALAGRLNDIPDPIIEVASRCSGGNVGVAVSVARAMLAVDATDSVPANDLDRLLRLIRLHTPLRLMAEQVLQGLAAEERETLRFVSVLTPAARRVGVAALGAACGAAVTVLEHRGLLRVRRDSIEPSSLFHEAAALFGVTDDDRTSMRRAAITRLESGSLQARLAAAQELQAVGETPRARGLAREVASGASRLGDLELASDARALLLRLSRGVTERAANGILSAEAELARGRPRTAGRILRRIVDGGLEKEQEVRARLSLARVSAALGAQDEARQLLRESAQISLQIEDPEQQAINQLLLLTTRLSLDLDLANDRDPSATAEQVSATLKQTTRLARDHAPVWLDALRAFVTYQIQTQSADAALGTLREFVRTRANMPEPASTLFSVWGSVFNLRAGEVSRARHLIEAVEASHPVTPTLQSLVLNNRSVIEMESGRFDRAAELFAAVRVVDAQMETAARDVTTPMANETQCAFFRRSRRVTAYAEKLRRTTQVWRQPGMTLQADAILGLEALAAGDDRTASRTLERIQDSRVGSRYDDDIYMALWFRAAVNQSKGASNHATEQLMNEAEWLDPLDGVAAAKLRLLGVLMDPTPSTALRETHSQRLRSMGAGWFVRFALDWCREAGLASGHARTVRV